MELWLWGVLLLKLALHAAGLKWSGARDRAVSCELEPVKASSFDPEVDNFCFRMALAPEDLTSNVVFTIEVVDALPYHTDSGRFGGTSKDRGRQSLHMSIVDPLSGDLLRSTRNLKSGTTVVEVNPRDSPQFELCFANLVCDSSWSSLDVLQMVSVHLATKEQLAWARLDSLQGTYQASNDLELCIKRITGVINGKLFRQLNEVEMQHRDYNESTHDSFLWALVVLVASIISSPLLLASYCINYRGRIRSRSTSRS